MRERELTIAERMVWGECPVCHAADGEYCHAEVGLPLWVSLVACHPPAVEAVEEPSL